LLSQYFVKPVKPVKPSKATNWNTSASVTSRSIGVKAGFQGTLTLAEPGVIPLQPHHNQAHDRLDTCIAC
jgi:hypothetical protein